MNEESEPQLIFFMQDKDLINKIQRLKTIQPNNDWAVSARQNLVNHIESSQPSAISHLLKVFRSFNHLPLAISHLPLASFFTPARMSAGFALTIVVLMVGSTILSQRSLPGQPFYSVKIALESAQSTVTPGSERRLNLQVSFAERRVAEVSQLASDKLNDEHIAVLSETLDAYREVLEEVTDAEMLNETVALIQEQTRVLTVAINESDASATFEDNLRASIEERLTDCTDADFTAQITELLASGDVASLIEANELSVRCASF